MDSDRMIMISLFVVGIGVLLLFGGVAAYILWQAITARRKADLSKTWPSVEGTIASSKLVEVRVHDSDGTRTGLQMQVEYDYTVNGVPYFNDKRTLGRVPKGIPYKKSQEVAAHYAAGAVVPVYYNPQNPQESCLEREAPLSNLLLIIGIFLAFVFLCFCCVGGVIALTAIQSGYQP